LAGSQGGNDPAIEVHHDGVNQAPNHDA